jgi:arylsulfatase
MIPRIYNHSYAISADLVIPEGGAEGVIVAEADHLGGFSLFVEGGKLRHTYSMMGVLVYRQESDTTLPCRGHRPPEFHADAPKPATGGDVRLFANAKEIGKGRMDFTVPLRFSGYAGMDIGRDNGGVVDRNYADRAPFTFTGTIRKVTFDIKPHLTSEDEQALHESAHHGHVAHGISG